MKIFIAGANGMVGNNLVDYFPQEIQLFTPGRDELNLLNFRDVLSYMESIKPDFVIHAAGLVGGIIVNIESPVKFLVDNTDMGRNLVLSSYKTGVKNFINLGSSCMYPRNALNPLTEDMILKGELEPTNEGYALSKIFTQRLCSYINRENKDFFYKTLIPCNLYGKYDKFHGKNSHMVPAVIKKIHNAVKNNLSMVEIWGSGKARREFLYAGDLADFIWFAVRNYDIIPETMNIGLGYDYTIDEYYKAVAKVADYTGDFFYNKSRPEGMMQKLVDISLQEKIGWKPKHSLEQGLEITYNFYVKKYQL